MAFDFLMNKKLDHIAINATENPVTGYWECCIPWFTVELGFFFLWRCCW